MKFIVVVVACVLFVSACSETPQNYTIVDVGGVEHNVYGICVTWVQDSFAGADLPMVDCRDADGNKVFSANYASISRGENKNEN